MPKDVTRGNEMHLFRSQIYIYTHINFIIFSPTERACENSACHAVYPLRQFLKFNAKFKLVSQKAVACKNGSVRHSNHTGNRRTGVPVFCSLDRV